MSAHRPLHEIERAIIMDDYDLFKKCLEEVDSIPFELETKIFSSKKDKFIIELYNEGKLSDKCRLMLGSMLSPKVKAILKLDKL